MHRELATIYEIGVGDMTDDLERMAAEFLRKSENEAAERDRRDHFTGVIEPATWETHLSDLRALLEPKHPMIKPQLGKRNYATLHKAAGHKVTQWCSLNVYIGDKLVLSRFNETREDVGYNSPESMGGNFNVTGQKGRFDEFAVAYTGFYTASESYYPSSKSVHWDTYHGHAEAFFPIFAARLAQELKDKGFV